MSDSPRSMKEGERLVPLLESVILPHGGHKWGATHRPGKIAYRHQQAVRFGPGGKEGSYRDWVNQTTNLYFNNLWNHLHGRSLSPRG